MLDIMNESPQNT